MIKFHFELYPLDEVSPWGDDRTDLHWFGLTEGWYWLEVGEQQLLRRTRLAHQRPYIDYYLARLWEDVNKLTPDVLEPVPADLQPFIASDRTHWVCDPLDFIAGQDEDGTEDVDVDAADHPVITAGEWHNEHYLDLGYVRNAPHLRFWRTVHTERDEITVDWQHKDDGEIGFTAGQAVRFSVPTAAYLDAVHTLDQELMAAMRQRIEELERRGRQPGVELDLAELRREHEDRAHWLDRKLAHPPKTDWVAVRQGARQLLGDAHQTDALEIPSLGRPQS